MNKIWHQIKGEQPLSLVVVLIKYCFESGDKNTKDEFWNFQELLGTLKGTFLELKETL